MDPQPCGRCGGVVIDGRCASCSPTLLQRFVHREIVLLLVLCAVGAVAFVATRAVAAAAESQRFRDAERWYERGERRLQAGDLEGAIEALRRASGIDRDRKEYRLTLARALAADSQHDAALQVLLGLRQLTPEDPEINLAIARLEAQRQDVTAANRYYASAVYGQWRGEDLAPRQRVRVEFIRYLLDRGLRDRALSELLVLAADLPDDPQRQIEVAEMYLDAGDSGRALELFSRALRQEPKSAAALAGAGRAAFAQGDYGRAQRFLRQAPASVAGVDELRQTVGLILANDPLAPRLAVSTRRRRASAALAWAAEYLDACAAQGTTAPLDELRGAVAQLQKTVAAARASNVAELAEDALALVAGVDDTAPAGCRGDRPADRAWPLIARRHGLER